MSEVLKTLRQSIYNFKLIISMEHCQNLKRKKIKIRKSNLQGFIQKDILKTNLI